MRSIVQYLGSEEFPRLRVGIGAAESVSARDFVLGEFDAESRTEFEGALGRAVEAVETFVLEGPAATMNRFNQ